MLRPLAVILFTVALSIGIVSATADSTEEIVSTGGKGANEVVVKSNGGGESGNKPAKGREEETYSAKRGVLL